MGYSRDGFHFSRPSHEPFLNVHEYNQSWNWGNVQSVNGTPLIVGNKLYFYCSGRRLNPDMWDAYTSTGLAILRRDGFVSRAAGNKLGTLTTEIVRFDGRYLFVNVDLVEKQGQLIVEILDGTGKPILGYTESDCRILSGVDSTSTIITWKQHSDLAPLIGKPVRFRFRLSNGHLYSFWVSPWTTGQSRGYTAGGGPGLSPSGIDSTVPIRN